MEKADIIKLAQLVRGGKATINEKLKLLQVLKEEMDKLSRVLDEVPK